MLTARLLYHGAHGETAEGHGGLPLLGVTRARPAVRYGAGAVLQELQLWSSVALRFFLRVLRGEKDQRCRPNPKAARGLSNTLAVRVRH